MSGSVKVLLNGKGVKKFDEKALRNIWAVVSQHKKIYVTLEWFEWNAPIGQFLGWGTVKGIWGIAPRSVTAQSYLYIGEWLSDQNLLYISPSVF